LTAQLPFSAQSTSSHPRFLNQKKNAEMKFVVPDFLYPLFYRHLKRGVKGDHGNNVCVFFLVILGYVA